MSRAAGGREKVPGTLDDYAFTIHACIDAWMASGDMSYYHAAVKLADAMIARFHDSAFGGFFDSAVSHEIPLGALSARRKPLQDSPTPAGNPTAAAALLRLEALDGNKHIARSRKIRWLVLPALWGTSASTRAVMAWRRSGFCSILCKW